MNGIKFLSIFVLVVLLLSTGITAAMGQEPPPENSANEGHLLLQPGDVAAFEDERSQDQEAVVVQRTVEEYFDAKLQIRLGKATAATLERFFDQANSDGREALRREAMKAQGFFERTEQVGPPVQDGSVGVKIEFERLMVSPLTFAVREIQSYAILHPTLGKCTTEEVFDHILHLVLIGDLWLIVRDDYFDPGGDAMLARGNFTALTTTEVPDDLGMSPDRRAEVGVLPATVYVYNRTAAYNYAENHWNDYNDWYEDFCGSGGDCANFASQVVLAGEYPKQWSGSYQWWYNHNGTQDPGNDTWSTSWINVWYQKLALDYHYGYFTGSANNLKVGDLVYMDWTGDGTWDHVAIVVVADPSGGNPLLDAHCNDRHQMSLSWFGAASNYYFRVYDSV